VGDILVLLRCPLLWTTERPVPILFDYETAEQHYRAL